MDYFRQQPEYQNHRNLFTDEADMSSDDWLRQRTGQSQSSSSRKQSGGSRRSQSEPAYDPYATLEVSPDAPFEEIEKAYRKMARKYHPDRYQDPQERETATRVMALINASYTFLKQKHGKK